MSYFGYPIDSQSFEKKPIDAKIQKNANGTISFSRSNLAYIEKQYPTTFSQFINKCLGQVGLHGSTNQFSVTGYIESDHTIPYNVWSSTTNAKMKKLIQGVGARPGEGLMPAMTIPRSIHRKLLTTGSSQAAKTFRTQLTQLCNQGKIKNALVLCIEDYQRNNLNLNAYKQDLLNLIHEYQNLEFITATERKEIQKQFKLS